MGELKLRLRFDVDVEMNIADVRSLLKARLTNKVDQIHGHVSNNHCTIKLPLQDRSFWSPQLELSLYEHDGRTNIKGVFGPQTNLWLLFMFCYMVCSCVLLFGLTIGFSQLTIGKSPYGFLGIIVSLVSIMTLHLTSKYGQTKTRHQIDDLMFFLKNALSLRDISAPE